MKVRPAGLRGITSKVDTILSDLSMKPVYRHAGLATPLLKTREKSPIA